MNKVSECYIAFGGNLSNPEQTFREAVTVLKEQGVMVNQMSSLWQSPAWPPSSQQPDYINAVGRASFLGVADELLQILHRVEARFGRMRSVINAARVLDLDLLSFGDFVLDRADIQVPHPRMMDRGFVLLPLSELSPDWKHPKTGEVVWDAIAKLPSCAVQSLKRLKSFDLE